MPFHWKFSLQVLAFKWYICFPLFWLFPWSLVWPKIFGCFNLIYGKWSVHCDVRDMEFRKELESWSDLHHYTFHFSMFYLLLLLLFLALMLRFYLVVLYISSVFFICLFRSRRYLIYSHKLINTIHTTL